MVHGMTTLREHLEQDVSTWAQIGHPDLLKRFVLRHGKAYQPRKRIGCCGPGGQCYKNAAQFVLAHPGSRYVEGYMIGPGLPIALEHAWVTMTGTDAMDPTLDAAGREYFGVPFETAVLEEELIRNGVYGLLDTGVGLNARLMFGIDPELENVVNEIVANRRKATQPEPHDAHVKAYEREMQDRADQHWVSNGGSLITECGTLIEGPE